MTISTGLANLICIGFTVIYIIGFYMFKIPGSRNHPPVIRARMKAVTVASLISVAIVRYLTTANLLTVLGLTFNIQALIKPLLLTSLLFLGPISIRYFDDELPFQKNFNFHRDVILTLTEPLGQRNYYVAPFTEELVFRACMIVVLYQANYSKGYLIFTSPLYFGLAHLHHAWENYYVLGGTRQAMIQSISASLFQFAYTTVFGWYVSYLFLKTGSLWSCVICHSFCNIMGFPDFSCIKYRRKREIQFIYACFPIGVFLFIMLFQLLTQTGDSIYWT